MATSSSRTQTQGIYLQSCIEGAVNSSSNSPIIFIHGWGSDSRQWQPLVEHLGQTHSLHFIDLPGFGFNSECIATNIEALLSQIESLLPDKAHIVGWSLGGMIATRLCERFSSRFLSLTTLACNAKFTCSEDWPLACDKVFYRDFIKSFSRDAESALSRFFLLQAQGDLRKKALIGSLKTNHASLTQEQKLLWQQALVWLDDIDNRQVLTQIKVPHLAIFGKNDALVPQGSSSNFHQHAYADVCIEIDSAAHAPHISHPKSVAYSLKKFVEKFDNQYKKNKRDVAISFSAAAKNYDRVATLQRKVATRLISMRESYEGDVCDLACGTGFCIEALSEQPCSIVGLDIAQGMLQRCQNKNGQHGSSLVCADFESLPFRTRLFDGLCSSMSLQWSDDLIKVFSEAKRVMKPGAWFSFSTLGPDTLKELRHSWAKVDRYVHVNRFDDLETIQAVLARCGFVVDIKLIEKEILEYDNVFNLMRDLKSIGAHNLNAGKSSFLTTRGKLKKLELAYEQYRTGGYLPATYEVYYVLARVK